MICGGHCPTELSRTLEKTGRGHTPEEKVCFGIIPEHKYALPSSIIKSFWVITFINKNICHGCVHKESIKYLFVNTNILSSTLPLPRCYNEQRKLCSVFLFPFWLPLEHGTLMKLPVSLQFLNLGQSVGLLGE
jgi:hypothetical protein